MLLHMDWSLFPVDVLALMVPAVEPVAEWTKKWKAEKTQNKDDQWNRLYFNVLDVRSIYAICYLRFSAAIHELNQL